MARGLNYFSELREYNRRLNRLYEDIDKFDRNNHHLDALMIEYKEAEEELFHLKLQWEQNYLPAIERGQLLRSELHLARNQPEEFRSIVFKELCGLRSNEIQKKISVLETTLKSTRFCYTEVSNEELSDDYAAQTAVKQEEPFKPEGVLAERTKKPHIIWTVRSAVERLKELERRHQEIILKMGSLGSRSCALTVQLKSLQEKIEEYKASMKIPAEMFYLSLNAELVPLKIKAYGCFLEQRNASEPSAIRHNGNAPSLCHYNRRCNDNLSHSRSASNITAQSTPSWVTSIASSMTEVSLIGSDFLKSTENTLNETTTRWL